jgi:hypothetical protein
LEDQIALSGPSSFESSLAQATTRIDSQLSQSLPDEQYGLSLLYDAGRRLSPDNTTIGGAKSVDIIAIHGLNGGALKSWTHANGKCWLKDFLPEKLPDARIYTFGYPAQLAFSRSLARVEDFARQLVVDLAIKRSAEAVG